MLQILFIFFGPLYVLAAAPQSSDRILLKKILGAESLKVLQAKAKNGEKRIKAGEDLYLGDVIFTEPKQIAVLEGYDGSQWKVAPNSSLKLEKQIPDKKNYSYWVLQVAHGGLWGKVPHVADKDGFRLKVKTQNAAMGIRGTEYLLATDGVRSELDVIEGIVWWGTSDKFEPGSYAEVKAGEHAELKGQEKIPPIATPFKGDDLLRHYQLFWQEENGKSADVVSPPADPQSCRARGMAWRLKNGVGECFSQGLIED